MLKCFLLTIALALPLQGFGDKADLVKIASRAALISNKIDQTGLKFINGYGQLQPLDQSANTENFLNGTAKAIVTAPTKLGLKDPVGVSFKATSVDPANVSMQVDVTDKNFSKVLSTNHVNYNITEREKIYVPDTTANRIGNVLSGAMFGYTSFVLLNLLRSPAILGGAKMAIILGAASILSISWDYLKAAVLGYCDFNLFRWEDCPEF